MSRHSTSAVLRRPLCNSMALRYTIVLALGIIALLLVSISLQMHAKTGDLRPNTVRPQIGHTIVDLRPFLNNHCLPSLLDYRTSALSGAGNICTVPFGSWIGKDHAEGLSCDALPEGACREQALKPPADVDITCGNGPQAHLRSQLRCTVTSDFQKSRTASAVILTHVGVSSAVGNPDTLRALLWPPERLQHDMVWALSIMYESTSYYTAGSDPAVLGQFDYLFGSKLHFGSAFKLSYLPDWPALLRPVNMTAKEELGASLRQAPIVWIASNCASRSGREDYVRGLMQHIGVDSFGRCLNNRDAGSFAMKSDGSNWNEALHSKHMLMSAYKFALVIENSLEEDYVSEKILDAWEAGSVPLYLGAPNIAEYVPGRHAFIDLRNKTHAEVAALVQRLDADPVEYAKYHAWRDAPVDDIKMRSPLGQRHAAHQAADPLCDICRLAHTRRGSSGLSQPSADG